jgi:hypothetical protein
MRLYSIACARDGEKPNTRTMALAVKRVVERDAQGGEVRGVASNWLCDLGPGDRVDLIGPFGSTFLMPDDSEADILMICTGTGVAPFRGFTHRRRRTYPNAIGSATCETTTARRPRAQSALASWSKASRSIAPAWLSSSRPAAARARAASAAACCPQARYGLARDRLLQFPNEGLREHARARRLACRRDDQVRREARATTPTPPTYRPSP